MLHVLPAGEKPPARRASRGKAEASPVMIAVS
jgi:hypothetical protein